MDRGRSPSQGVHIKHSPSPSPHAFHNPNQSGVGLDQSLSQDLSQQQQFNTQYNQQFDFNQTPFNQNSLFNIESNTQTSAGTIDPSFLNDAVSNSQSFVDPVLFDSKFDTGPLMNTMATSQAHSPTPPHLLGVQSGAHRATSTSPHHSPNLNQPGFPSPNHSRHASLDPSSAQFPNMQNSEWANMTFQGHRRAPSETAFSDVSSQHNSPFMGNTENFDEQNPSPLLQAQDPTMYQDLTNFGTFSINENGQPRISPGHSPHVSPRLVPQQHSLPPFTAANNYGLNVADNQAIGLYNNPTNEPFPAIIGGPNAPHEYGGADQMSPPEINIDFAPPSRVNSFEPPKPGMDQGNALSPPDRSRSRNRMRTKSDPLSQATSRSSSVGAASDTNSLSPNAAKSRSPSPSSKSNRRSSTSSIPQRDYILDLADPSRPHSGSVGEGSGPRRTQKHPATFQCSLCPKKFTRAYNLRSHLRTHTDERPFVCSVCGKAFARQHDRKRHEGLHSGEKKFVCRGVLKDSGNWGCGRRFARADALGRHFRSEAGRVCIRPLLEEEAQEKGWEQQQQMQQPNGMLGGMVPTSMPGMPMGQPGFDSFATGDPSMQGGMMAAPSYALPAALLAQYPALAGIQWDALPSGPPDEYEGEISGRSSFDASSGGEYYEDEEPQQQPGGTQSFGWSDYEQQGQRA